MIITHSMKVCCAQHLATNSQGQGHSFDSNSISPSVSHAVNLGFMCRPYLKSQLGNHVIFPFSRDPIISIDIKWADSNICVLITQILYFQFKRDPQLVL